MNDDLQNLVTAPKVAPVTTHQIVDLAKVLLTMPQVEIGSTKEAVTIAAAMFKRAKEAADEINYPGKIVDKLKEPEPGSTVSDGFFDERY
jgi:hypothetical protein